MPVSKRLEQGDRLGDYEIVSIAGVGGMGVVYKAKQQSLDRVVALKVIRDEIASEPEFRQRFLREARLAASVDHPHVVAVYDVGSKDDQLYLTMQWIDGADLKKLLEESGRLSPMRAVAIGTQLAGALDAVHSVSGLIHRDVKPGNILVREVEGEDHAYLTDFGVAKPSHGAENLTKTGSTVGTVGYLSPEQIQGHESGPRSDLYALGCLVFETLTGEQPFKGDNEMAVRWAHANDQRPMVSTLLPALGHRYDHFFSLALAVDPDTRFGSGREFAEALAEAQARESGEAVTSVMSSPRTPTAVGPPTPMPPPAHNRQTPSSGQPPYGYVTPSPPPAHARSGNPLALILLAVVAIAGIAVGALAAAGVFSNSGGIRIVSASTGASRRHSPPRSAQAPSGTESCGGGVSVGPATTCPFARNVKRAYVSSGGSSTVTAYSPVTGVTYTMHCTGEVTHECTGGNNASVYFSSSLVSAPAESSPTTPTPPQSPPSSLQSCDENISASSATSCPFAENVFVAYWEEYRAYGEQPETYVSAFSSATGHTYGMSCTFDGVTVECSGGNNAFVTFPMQAVRVY